MHESMSMLPPSSCSMSSSFSLTNLSGNRCNNINILPRTRSRRWRRNTFFAIEKVKYISNITLIRKLHLRNSFFFFNKTFLFLFSFFIRPVIKICLYLELTQNNLCYVFWEEITPIYSLSNGWKMWNEHPMKISHENRRKMTLMELEFIWFFQNLKKAHIKRVIKAIQDKRAVLTIFFSF